MEQTEATIQLSGDKDIKKITGTYNTEGTYDEDLFKKPEYLNDIEGYEVQEDSSGNIQSVSVISGSIKDIKYNGDSQMVIWTNDNYQTTTYTPVGTVSESEFNFTQDSLLNGNFEQGNTVILDGGVSYNAHSSSDLKDIKKDMESRGVSCEGMPEKYGDNVESYEFNFGVHQTVIDADGVVQSDEEITNGKQNNKTEYTSDGVNWTTERDDIDTNVMATRNETVILFQNVTEKTTNELGEEIEVTTSQTQHTETTYNYSVGLYSQTFTVNGEEKVLAAKTSETIISSFDQTTTRSDYDGVLLLTGCTQTITNYSDGSSITHTEAESEQRLTWDRQTNNAYVDTEYGIVEDSRSDGSGNVFVDKTAVSGTTFDVSANMVTKEAQGIYTHTETIGDTRRVEIHVDSQTSYTMYGDNQVVTYSTDVESKKEYKLLDNGTNQLTYSYEDSGEYIVVAKDPTGQDYVMRNGRDISESTYEYDGDAKNPSTETYRRTSYDYIDGSATVSEGVKNNIYDDDNLTEYTDTYTTNTYGLNDDLTINEFDLKKTEEGVNREYDISVVKDDVSNTTTRTSRSDQYIKVYDYENNSFYVTTNTGVENRTVVDNATGIIKDKEVSGTLNTWVFDSRSSLDSVNLDSIVTTGGYVGDVGQLDTERSYSYTYSGYTYDAYGRETGYSFEKENTDGSKVTGEVRTEYSIELQDDYKLINGEKVYIAKTYATTTTTTNFEDGTTKTETGKPTYYSNSGIGDTSIFNASTSVNIKSVNITNAAVDMLKNTNVRKAFTKADNIEQSEVVKIVVAAVVAVVAIVTTVLSFGSAAAFWGAILGAGTAAATTAAVITTAVVAATSAYLAAKYAVAAVDCAYDGDWAGFGMNAVFALTSMFGGAKFLQGLGALAPAITQGALKGLGKALLKTAVKRAAIGAAMGATATAAFMLADHYMNGRDYTFGEAVRNIAIGTLAGGLAGALTTNIGGVMGKAGMLTTTLAKQIQFANMVLNLGKNLLVAGNILKAAGNYIISDSSFSTSQQNLMINIFDSAVDIYMFMSAGGNLNPGAGGQEQVAKRFGQILKDTFTKQGLIGGGIGAAVFAGGTIIYQATNGFSESWNFNNVNWLNVGQMAFAGFVLGGGIGNVQHAGWKNAYKGAWTALKGGLAPTQLFTNSVQMISRIMQMQMIVTGGGAILENITGGWFTKILEYSGIGLVDEAFSKMGVGMNLIGNMRDLAENLTLQGISNFALQTKATMTEPSMWVFSIATAVAQPILSPILLRTPILGTTMQFMNRFGDSVSNVKGAGEMLNMVYEEGFKESISGLFGQMIFGNSQFGEIFQELFDETPDGISDINLLASSNIDSATVNTVATNINNASKSKNNNINVDAVIQQAYEQLGLSSGNSTITFDMFKSAIGNSIGSKSLNTTINDILLANSIAQSSENTTNSEIETIIRTWNDGIDSINTQLSNVSNPNSSKGRQLANELATFQTARDNEVQSATSGTQAIFENIQAARASILNTNRKLSENQVLNAVYAQLQMNGQSISDIDITSEQGIKIFVNYVDYLVTTNNSTELVNVAQNYVKNVSEQLNTLKDQVNSKDTQTRETANHQILRNMTALQFVMTAADSLSIRSIDAENVTAENVMTQLQNLADSNNLENLKKDIESKLKEENISETEQKLYSRINEILTSGDYSAADIRLILNTNSSDFFVQNDNLSEHGRDLRQVRNEIMSLAKASMLENIQSINTNIDAGNSDGEAYDLMQAIVLRQQINSNLNLFGNISSDYLANVSIKDMMSEISSLSDIKVDEVLQTAKETEIERKARKDFENLLKGKKTVSQQFAAIDQKLKEIDNSETKESKALKSLLISSLSSFNILSILNKSEVKDLTTEDINTINDFVSGLKSNTVQKYVYAQILGLVRDTMQQSEEFSSRKEANEAINEIYATISECKEENKTLSDIFKGTNIEKVLGVLGNIEVTDSLVNVSNVEEATRQADELFNLGTEGWNLKQGKNGAKGQIDSVRDILNGENLAILAAVGYGKTAIPVGVALGRSAMGMVNMDLVVANAEEYNKYLNNKFSSSHSRTIREVIELSGAKVYDMDVLAEKAMHGTQADIDVFREAMLDKNGFRIWTGEKMGFLGTQAASEAASNGRVELQQILDQFQAQTDRLTIADEVHKFMESQTSFILSSGSESLTKSKSWNQENNPKLEQAYDYARQLFESGEIDVDAEGTATISKDLSSKIDSFAKSHGFNRTWVDSAIKAIVEKAKGKDTYGIAIQPDGSKHIVPVSNGNKEDGRVFQDVAYAYAAAREMGENHSQALNCVQISKTDFGTSGSRLFFGAGQYVGMSGTLAHVQDMAASFGMEIRVYGEEKNFKLVSDPGQLGGMQTDDVLFREIEGSSTKEIRDNMVEQMYNQIIQNLSNENARTQLVMSVDENVRNELVRRLTEAGYGDRIDQITTETENTTDIIDQTVKENGKTKKDDNDHAIPVGGKDARIIICNEKGAMGLDYAGNFDLLVDSTGASSSLLTQTYGRVNRHVSTENEMCTRTLYANTYEIDSLMKDLSNPIILSGIYSQLSNSPSQLDRDMAERLFDVTRDSEGKVTDVKIKDSDNMVNNFELAKAYSLFKQSGQSLIFGLADSIRDVYLTKAFNDLIVKAGGKDTLEGAIIYKVLQDQLLNHEEGANTRIEGENDIVDGNRQMEQRILQLQNEALEAFRAVQTHLREVNGSSNIIDSVMDNISAWENVNISSKDSVISKAITRTTSLQEAVDIMMSYGNNVVASDGKNGNVEGTPTTIVDISKNLQEAGITNYESLSEAISSDPTLSVNGQLTYLGQQVVENYKKLNKIPYDDDFIKVIMALFGMLGIDFDMGGQTLQSLEKSERSALFTKASVKLAKENISVDKLMTFANMDIAKEISEVSESDGEDRALKLKQILGAEYPVGLKEYLAQNNKEVILPDPMLLKAMDVISNEEDDNKFYRQLVESYNQLVNSFEQAKYAGSRLSATDRAMATNNSKLGKVVGKVNSVAKMFLNYMLVMPFYTAIRSVAGDVVGTAIMSTSKGIKLLPEKTDNETYNTLKALGIFGIMKASIYNVQDKNFNKNIENKIGKTANKMNNLLDEYNKDLNDILKDVSKESEIAQYVTERLQTRGIYDVDVVVKDNKLEVKSASNSSLNTLNADLLIQEMFGISPEKDGYYDISKMSAKVSQETKVLLKAQMAFTQEISGTDELMDTVISLNIFNKDMLKGIEIKDIKKLSVFNEVVEKANKENSVDGKTTIALSSLTQEDVKAIINSVNPKAELNKRMGLDADNAAELTKDKVVSEMIKGADVSEKEKEILGTIINGVSAPEEFNKVMEYVFAIWDKDMDKMLSYIDLTREKIDGKATKQIVQTIVKASVNKMAEAVDLCKAGKISEKEAEVEIKLVSGLRDLLITASQQENADNFLTESNDAIKSKLIRNKAVNQNVIVNMFEKAVNDSAVDTDDSDFVIDVKKLQSAVVDKTIKFAKDANIDSVMDILKDAKSDRFRTPLMRLSDIHAVAASA